MAVTLSFLVVYIIGIIGGWHLTFQLYNRSQNYYKKKLENLAMEHYDNGKWTDDENVFKHWVFVEMTARYALDSLKGRKRPYSEDINNMRKIFERGLMEFPENSHLTVLFSLYTCNAFGKKPQSFSIMHRLEVSRLFMDSQIQCYMHLQLELKDKELSFLDSDATLDAAVANEYARIIQDTKLNHYIATLYARAMWRLVSDRAYDTSKLEKVSENMNRAVIKASDGYKRLIQKFPRSAALYRYYAHFSTHVLGDEDEAHQLNAQAQVLEVAKAEALAAAKKKTGGAAATLTKPPVNPRTLSDMTMTSNRAKESAKIRSKLLARNAGDIKLLFAATAIIGILSFGILIASHLLIGDVIKIYFRCSIRLNKVLVIWDNTMIVISRLL